MPLLDLLSQDNIIVHKVAITHGGEYQGPCPICGGKDRFHAWPEEGDGGKWWCRGCEKGGDCIQYLRDVRKLGYWEACLMAGQKPAPLRKTFDWGPSVQSQDQGQGRKWVPREIIPPPVEWSKKCQAFVDWAHKQLLKTPQIISWMTCSRGLAEKMIKSLRLGYNPVGLKRGRFFWGLEEKLKKNNTPQDIWLPQGIIIPYFVDGILQRARIRRIDLQGQTPEQGPPYCIVSGSTSATMVLDNCGRVAVVVESELDAMLLYQEFGNMADPLAGVMALGNAQARPDSHAAGILRAADLILVALDSDDHRDDGQNPGAKEAQWWLSHFPQARRLPPVDGKDPGEMWRNGVDLQQWVACGINKYYPQVKCQGNTEMAISMLMPVPISQPQDPQFVEFDILEQIFAEKFDQVAQAFTMNSKIDYLAWYDQNRAFTKNWARDQDWVDEVWKLCMLGKSTLQDFRVAVDIWFETAMQIMQKFKETSNGSI